MLTIKEYHIRQGDLNFHHSQVNKIRFIRLSIYVLQAYNIPHIFKLTSPLPRQVVLNLLLYLNH